VNSSSGRSVRGLGKTLAVLLVQSET